MAARPPKRRPKPQRAAAPEAKSVRSLERRIARLEAEAAEAAARHERQLAAVRRAADRRLASMVREIAMLRHHEARATALERLVAERDATIARQARLGAAPVPSAENAPPPAS